MTAVGSERQSTSGSSQYNSTSLPSGSRTYNDHVAVWSLAPSMGTPAATNSSLAVRNPSLESPTLMPR